MKRKWGWGGGFLFSSKPRRMRDVNRKYDPNTLCAHKLLSISMDGRRMHETNECARRSGRNNTKESNIRDAPNTPYFRHIMISSARPAWQDYGRTFGTIKGEFDFKRREIERKTLKRRCVDAETPRRRHVDAKIDDGKSTTKRRPSWKRSR